MCVTCGAPPTSALPSQVKTVMVVVELLNS
jgi:hypothetical protein